MVALGFVVPVRRDHEPRDAVDAPAEDAQHVERRLVRPVDVLDHDDRGAVELREQRPRHRPRVRPGREQLRQRPARAVGDVSERAERARRGEVLARPGKDPRVRSPAELADERGLADPGLAADEHEPAALPPSLREEAEQRLPLEQAGHRLVRDDCGGFERFIRQMFADVAPERDLPPRTRRRRLGFGHAGRGDS